MEDEEEELEEQVVMEQGERWYWRVDVGREWDWRRVDEERDILAKQGLEILIEAAIVITRSYLKVFLQGKRKKMWRRVCKSIETSCNGWCEEAVCRGANYLLSADVYL